MSRGHRFGPRTGVIATYDVAARGASTVFPPANDETARLPVDPTPKSAGSRRTAARWALCALVSACGTIGDSGDGVAVLPSAEVGPFRAFRDADLKGTAPFVLDDARAQYSDPAVLDGDAGPGGSSGASGAGSSGASGAGSSGGGGAGSSGAGQRGVILYAVSAGAIVRTRSLDGRTFFGNGQVGKTPATVLRADQEWEGEALSGPFAFRRGAEVLLYYAGRDGLGVARSTDALSFVKEPGPILRDARSPTVFSLLDGRSRMFYVANGVIAEAESPDGVTWTRLPGTSLAPSGDPVAFDALAVGDPCANTRITPAGRFHVRVLYTGTNAAGTTAIGLAARYGEDGPLSRNAVPAFPSGASPAYLAPFLYVTQLHGTYPSIAGAVEPLDATLAPPSDYPIGP